MSTDFPSQPLLSPLPRDPAQNFFPAHTCRLTRCSAFIFGGRPVFFARTAAFLADEFVGREIRADGATGATTRPGRPPVLSDWPTWMSAAESGCSQGCRRRFKVKQRSHATSILTRLALPSLLPPLAKFFSIMQFILFACAPSPIRPPTNPARWCHPPQILTYLSFGESNWADAGVHRRISRFALPVHREEIYC